MVFTEHRAKSLFFLLLVFYGFSVQATEPVNCDSVFRLVKTEQSTVKRASMHLVEWFIGLKELNSEIQRLRSLPSSGNTWQDILEARDMKVRLAQGSLSSIPGQGVGTIIIANHPRGFSDGVALGYVLEVLKARSDVKVLYNDMLTSILPELSSRAIEVDISNSPSFAKAKKNKAAVQEAEDHLKAGGALIYFPAGSVSSYQRGFLETETGEIRRTWEMQYTDSAWNGTLAKLAVNSEAKLIPIFIEGKNSYLWNTLDAVDSMQSMLSDKYLGLRLAAMIREFLALKGEEVSIRIGESIDFIDPMLKHIGNSKSEDAIRLTEWFRRILYSLSDNSYWELSPRHKVNDTREIESDLARDREEAQRRVSKKEETAAFQFSDIEDLHLKGILKNLVVSADFSVVYGNGRDLVGSSLMNEMGRLRARTFSEVGEGSGVDIDLEAFDAYYDQLFILDNKEQKLVGGYRIGRTDEILAEMGMEAVYSTQFFQYDREFFDGLGPSLEMGRTIIASEYQGSRALELVWKGIAQYLDQNPKYISMIGPVSISQQFSALSQALIVYFYTKKHGPTKLAYLADHIHSQNAYHLNQEWRKLIASGELTEDLIQRVEAARNSKELDSIIAEVEKDNSNSMLHKAPSLFAYYSDLLGGKYYSFDRDMSFGSVDGLVIVRTTDIPLRMLGYFFGDKELAKSHREKQFEMYPELDQE